MKSLHLRGGATPTRDVPCESTNIDVVRLSEWRPDQIGIESLSIFLPSKNLQYVTFILAHSGTFLTSPKSDIIDSLDGIRGGDATGGAVRDTGLLVMSIAGIQIVLVVADHQTKTSWVDVAMAPKEERTKDGLGHDIKDSVEDGLGVGSDHVATLG